MRADRHQSFDNDSRVIKFRPRAGKWRGFHTRKPPINDLETEGSPVADLSKYEGLESKEDYQHRMAVNAAAFLFTVLLILAGVWIANMMAHS